MASNAQWASRGTLTSVMWTLLVGLFVFALAGQALGQAVGQHIPTDCKVIADAGSWETESPNRIYASNAAWIPLGCSLTVTDFKLTSSIYSEDPESNPPYREEKDEGYNPDAQVNSGSVWQAVKWYEIECFVGKGLAEYVGVGTNSDLDKECHFV